MDDHTTPRGGEESDGEHELHDTHVHEHPLVAELGHKARQRELHEGRRLRLTPVAIRPVSELYPDGAPGGLIYPDLPDALAELAQVSAASKGAARRKGEELQQLQEMMGEMLAAQRRSEGALAAMAERLASSDKLEARMQVLDAKMSAVGGAVAQVQEQVARLGGKSGSTARDGFTIGGFTFGGDSRRPAPQPLLSTTVEGSAFSTRRPLEA